MAEGWISVHRKICDNWVWQDKPFSKGQAWIDLLLLAYHEDVEKLYRGQVRTYHRGEVHVSIAFLAERWGWDWRKVKRYIMALEKTNMVTSNSTPDGTTLTIVKYDDFQGHGRANGRGDGRADGRTDGRADGIQSINNNSNNDNNVYARPRRMSYSEKLQESDRKWREHIVKQAKEDIAEWHKENPGEPLPPEMVELCEQYSIDYSEI